MKIGSPIRSSRSGLSQTPRSSLREAARRNNLELHNIRQTPSTPLNPFSRGLRLTGRGPRSSDLRGGRARTLNPPAQTSAGLIAKPRTPENSQPTQRPVPLPSNQRRTIMRLVKFRTHDHPTPRAALLQDDRLLPLASGHGCLSDLLHADDVAAEVLRRGDSAGSSLAAGSVRILAPLDEQEVWGAGVTYERSKVARQEESLRGGSFYDQVYQAERPELFLKATPGRVVGPGEPIRVRRDSRWTVPEPELAMVLSPALKLVGFTIGNDVSARDIEGENPLYLPQAKVYDASCALGPCITLTESMPARAEIGIRLEIVRGGAQLYQGQTS